MRREFDRSADEARMRAEGLRYSQAQTASKSSSVADPPKKALGLRTWVRRLLSKPSDRETAPL